MPAILNQQTVLNTNVSFFFFFLLSFFSLKLSARSAVRNTNVTSFFLSFFLSFLFWMHIIFLIFLSLTWESAYNFNIVIVGLLILSYQSNCWQAGYYMGKGVVDLCWTCLETCLELPKSRYVVSLHSDLMDQSEDSRKLDDHQWKQ